MPTATILGNTYQTVVMPDGNEWMIEDLIGGSPAALMSPPEFGYRWPLSYVQSFVPVDGWHIPSEAEFRAMLVASGYPLNGTSFYLGGGALKSTDPAFWNAPNSGAANAYGWNLVSGAFIPSYYPYKGTVGRLWSSTPLPFTPDFERQVALTMTSGDPWAIIGFAYEYEYWPIRLVRPAGIHGIYPAKDGVWRRANEVHVAHGGAWHKASRILVADAGAWREVQ